MVKTSMAQSGSMKTFSPRQPLLPFDMRLLALFLATALTASSSANAGTISGTVRAQGKESSEGAGGGKYDSRKFKFAERIDYTELRDFIVYIDGPLGTNAAPPEKPVQVLTTRKIS